MPVTLQQSIGERVRHRRMERHFCQKDFAHLVGWQPDYLSRFERGRWAQIDPERLIALANALGISTDVLLGFPQ
jgi:transcriptional regulator with XRE-family HTH domain